MFRNLKLFGKFTLIAVLTPLAVILIAGVALTGAGAIKRDGIDVLKYEFDNLYGFMLLPIMDLDEANLHREKLTGALDQLTRADLSASERGTLEALVRREEEGMVKLHEKYKTEWKTTVSPEFTAALARLGQSSLQKDEQTYLDRIDGAYAQLAPLRQRLLAGQVIGRADLADRSSEIERGFADLVAVNKKFADLSNTSAQSAFASTETVLAAVRRNIGITGILLTILALAAAFYLARLVLRQVNSISQTFTRIGIGDFGARAEVLGRDELGVTSRSLNAMLDNTLSLIQSREERDSIQGSIVKLLDEVSGVADGDLTREAEVTADVTGAIADSFNLMISELRRIISTARDTTFQVSSAANQIQSTAQHLAEGSERQSSELAGTSAAVDELAVSVAQVSESSVQAASVADQALATAKQGAEAVSKTIEGMSSIRQQVQETAKRIKRLGESSQEVGEIVQLIGDIADRTSILALNASIQAAMAGEAGRGFAVVAEEVERLAERSAEATKRIGTLIKSIQSETTEAVAAMEATTREVVGGSSLANEAGQALGAIQSVSNRLAEIIQSISLAAKQQARGSEGVARAMNDISQGTQRTAAGTKQAAVSIRNLAGLADDLRESMDRFRLPERSLADRLRLPERAA